MNKRNHPLFRKLDRIPGAPNFVRYNFEELAKTLRAYVAFAKSMPTISYAAGMSLIKDLVLGLSDAEQIKRAVRGVTDSPSKSSLVEFIDAFCNYAEERRYVATPTYMDFIAYFPIGRDLFIPVKPTLVAREHGQLKPIFTFGWKSVPLTHFQRRLLMTILEDAIFSLTDFEQSDAEIVFLPEINGVRIPEIWHRGDYNLLSEIELRNQLEIFLSAREAAYPIIDSWLSRKQPSRTEPPKDDSSQPRFDFPDGPPPGK